MGWLCYGQVKGVTGGVTIIRELLGVKGVTGDLNIIILTLVVSKVILEVHITSRLKLLVFLFCKLESL